VLVGVGFRGFTIVVMGVFLMPSCRLCVMRGLFVVAGFVLLRGFLMMMRSLCVMLGRLTMVVGCLLRH
jgi:hypothetical protein